MHKLDELTRSFNRAKELIDNNSYSGVLLCGDFNFHLINWDSFGLPHTKTDSLSENNFVECLLDCAFFQHVDFATFIKANQIETNCLDYVISESQNRI